MLEIEHRRVAREGYAFHAMLEAAMSAVIEDVKAARNLPFPLPRDPPRTPEAYAVRQRVKRAGFSELRNGFLRFGGALTTQSFLQLDKEIEDFAGQWIPATPRIGVAGGVIPQPPEGVNAGLQAQLERIESQAIALRAEAEDGMKRRASAVRGSRAAP